jgi:hypothetical protein
MIVGGLILDVLQGVLGIALELRVVKDTQVAVEGIYSWSHKTTPRITSSWKTRHYLIDQMQNNGASMIVDARWPSQTLVP